LVGVSEGVGVNVTVLVGVGVDVDVFVGVSVGVGVCVGVTEGVSVAVLVGVTEGVGVVVTVGVTVLVALTDGGGGLSTDTICPTHGPVLAPTTTQAEPLTCPVNSVLLKQSGLLVINSIAS
jgi:hypothetical protein